MKQNIFKLQSVFALAIVLLFSSCSTRLVDFTIISSKNHSINLSSAEGVDTEGKSMGFLGLGTSIKDALDDALNNAGRDYDILVDGVIRYQDYVFVVGYVVTGTAYNSSELKGKLGEKGYQEWLKNHNVLEPSEAN